MQAVSFNETTVTAGDRVRVSAVVANEGDEVGTFVVGLHVGDDTVASQRIRLGPGESGRVEFVRRFLDTGVYDVGVGSVVAGTVTVEPESTASPGRQSATATDRVTASGESGVEVLDAASVYTWVKTGYNGSVRATVANPGDEPASRELTVRVDGEAVATRTVALDPGERREVTLEFPAAEGAVTVDGVEAGNLQVGGTAAATGTTGDASAGSGPGFGPGAALLGLAVAAALSAVRRWKSGRNE